MNDSVLVYIALGSNLGDRRGHIDSAVERLRASRDIEIVAVSSLHETDPIGQPGQEKYMNAAAILRTGLPAREVLECLLTVEKIMGRQRDSLARWGPRIIDLDLLLYGDVVLNEPGLVVPHPRMHERAFVLDPLCEIAPNVLHPVLQQRVQAIQRGYRSGGVQAGNTHSQ